jgi:phage gp36-like protein
MQWSPPAVDVLLEAADPNERPVVGGLCFGMSMGELFPTIYQFAQIDGQLTTMRIRDYERDALVQCAATGAAFLLIHRKVLQQMAEKNFNEAFPFFQETQNGDKPVGEDLTFCLRVAALGYPLFVHTGVRVGHHKSNLLTEDMFLASAATEGGLMAYLAVSDLEAHLGRTLGAADETSAEAAVAAAVALIDHYLGFDIEAQDDVDGRRHRRVHGGGRACRGAVVHEPAGPCVVRRR